MSISMDSSSSSHQSKNPKPKRLKTLSCMVKFSGENILLHRFVLDNSYPNQSGSKIYMRAMLLSMSDVPASAVNALNDEGFTALHLAVLKNNLTMVKELLSCLVNIDVNARCHQHYRNTSLHLAAELDQSYIIQELLDKGADIDIKNNVRETALCVAASSGHLDVIKLLVSKGANVNMRCGGGTPLCYAVRSRSLEAVECLVCSGADINSEDRWSPLLLAVSWGNSAIVACLVRNGANVNVRDIDGKTPLHIAACSSHLDIVECLVRNGADINVQDRVGRTPLHSAIENLQSENMVFLLEQGANVNARDQHHETPLHYAVKEDDPIAAIMEGLEYIRLLAPQDVEIELNLEAINLLIEQRADLRAVDKEGETPLHGAAYVEDVKLDLTENYSHADSRWDPDYEAKVIRVLLDRGADVNAKNKNGETPLDLARNQSCIDALQDKDPTCALDP